jgi:hypothetical protein
MRIRYLAPVLAIALYVALSPDWMARAQQPTWSGTPYYVKRNGQVTRITRGDAAREQPREWEVWLYRNGEPANGARGGVWGSLRGPTAEAVMDELRRSQEFQVRYARWAEFDYTRERLTYFNPFGPIAVYDDQRNHSRDRRLTDLGRRLRDIRDGYNKISIAINGRNPNPFRGIGSQVAAYGKQVFDQTNEINRLENQLGQGISSNLEGTFAAMDRVLGELERRQPALEQLVSTVQPHQPLLRWNATPWQGWSLTVVVREGQAIGTLEAPQYRYSYSRTLAYDTAGVMRFDFPEHVYRSGLEACAEGSGCTSASEPIPASTIVVRVGPGGRLIGTASSPGSEDVQLEVEVAP